MTPLPPRTITVFILAIFLVHFLPFLLNSPNAYIRIHDNLEGEWIWLDLLVQQGKALDFSPLSEVDVMLNGQPRAAYPTGLSLNVLLICVFGSYWGYFISYFLLHALAFAGMYLLLRTHFIKDEQWEFISIGAALCFSLTPFYLQFGVAGHPLLLYCFLNILSDREKWTDFFYILLIPFFSSLVWTGFSAITAAMILLLHDSMRKKGLNRKFLLAIGLLLVSYCVVNFQMLSLSFLNKDFVSHRTEYVLSALQDMTFVKGLLDTIYPLLLAHYHVGTVLTILVFATVALSFFYYGKDRLINSLLATIAIVCLAYGFYFYAAWLLGDVFPLLVTFKANRFIIFLPLIFFLLFSIALKRMLEACIPRYALVIIIGCQLSIGFFSNDEWLHNVRNLFGQKVKPAYHDFFAENLFSEIDAHIALPKNSYRIMSLGMSPSVAQHNGFFTLDGLLPIYSLEHKRQFREIIAPELEKNEAVKNYYDAWGNRCYVFSSELGIEDRNYLIGKDAKMVLSDFEINTEIFKRMKGKFVFSAVQIKSPERTGLRLSRVFESEKSWWKIYLYEAI